LFIEKSESAEEVCASTSVPPRLFNTQKKVHREYADAADIRQQQINRSLTNVLSTLGFQATSIENRARTLMIQFIRERAKKHKTKELERKEQVEDKNTTRKQESNLCVHCQTDELCVAKHSNSITCKSCADQFYGCCRGRYCHTCLAADMNKQFPHKCRQKIEPFKEKSTSRLILAYPALACACVLRSLQEHEFQYRNLELRIFSQPQALQRWKRELETSLNLPSIPIEQRLRGFIHRYLLKLTPLKLVSQLHREERFDCDAIGSYFIHQQDNKVEYKRSVRQIDGILSLFLATARYLPKLILKSDKIYLHNHQIRIIAAVVVYLRLRLRQEFSFTEEEICEHLGMELRTFQACKNDLILLF
jgi:hypothetical protein